MTGPLISVIIPVYNAEKYLKNAINSVINQTYTNLEIILVNDCSTDNSLDIIKSFDDPRIRVINNSESLGAAGARNQGLDVYSGEFVTFIDADDYVHPKFVELLYEALVDKNADISCCNFTRTYSKKPRGGRKNASATNIQVMSGVEAALNIVDRHSMYYVVFWNKLYKRSIWEDLRLPTGKRAEDFYTSYLFLSKACKVAFIDACLYYYYQQKQSVMHVHDDFSIYMGEALDGFDKFLAQAITDEAKRHKYEELSLIFRTDTVVEDYWKAYKKKDHKRMEETWRQALLLRRDMVMRHVPIRNKFRLFYWNLFVYRFGRRMFDIKESIAIMFGRDREGRRE